MKRFTLGYLFSEKKLGKDEKIFVKICKKKKIDLVMFNILDKTNETELEKKAKKCDIIYNNSAEDFVYEIIKTLEALGKKVVDSSETYYYIEDKWLFYLKCKEHKIPAPETILLSENINLAKNEIREFNKWPVVLKRIEGTQGDFVERAKDLKEAEEIIKRFWGKAEERSPIIAQEFISSPSYRVTLIGDQIVQTALKENKGWKSTGVYQKKFKKFPINKKLKNIIKKVKDLSGIKICGIDFLEKDGAPLLLEVNTTPGFDFFENEREKIIEKVINFLKKEA
ncbi:MAG: ATP-grasp domain-containing protein [Nanoarchaeota archaeon]|nr:ATP-grasp domain-containing protein [Nanoarchaeota archaeon]